MKFDIHANDNLPYIEQSRDNFGDRRYALMYLNKRVSVYFNDLDTAHYAIGAFIRIRATNYEQANADVSAALAQPLRIAEQLPARPTVTP